MDMRSDMVRRPYGHLMRIKDEHIDIVRRMLNVGMYIREKEKKVAKPIGWEDA